MTTSKYFSNEFQENNGVLILDQDDKYVANFGKQWRDHVDIQIDSKNGFTCSQDLLENVIFSDLSYFKGKSVLEIGCGAGRFSEHIVKHAKDLVLVDLSQAIFFNVAQSNQNCNRIKADFLKLIPNKKFDIIICRGVLQHTPSPKDSIKKLYDFVKQDGEVVFDIYPPPKVGFLSPKYFLWRPFFKNLIKYENCEKFLINNIKVLLKLKRIIRKIFFNSRFISDCFIPVYDYKGLLDLDEKQLEDWAVLDTLDGMYAQYEYPMSFKKVHALLATINVEIRFASKQYNAFRTSSKN
jgi:ubiquinone/menaquinone biosynthesis C-methylase UbiE